MTSSPANTAGTVRPTPARVLVVDDEETLSELVGLALRYEGWDVRAAADGLSAIAAAREFRPDLVVLDVMLPDIDGLEVLRRLRAEIERVPVLFLTARDDVSDRIAGLTAGGDDYLTKPFSIEELVLRLRALLRRSPLALTSESSTIVVGDLVLDEDSREVRRGGDLIALTATEFELLRFLNAEPEAGDVQGALDPGSAGTTISAARRISSSSTFPICGRRSTPDGNR